MNIAVLSDTHLPARLSALPGVVYETCAEADLIIHAGDIEEPGVLSDLRRFAPVKAVSGNMDGMGITSRYPDRLILEAEGFTIAVAHGAGDYHGIRPRLRAMFQPAEPDIIIHGHTHRFSWEQDRGIWFLNPGAVSNPPASRTMAMLTLNQGKEPSATKIRL